jgi:non-ribosomal peptide synthetase component E (peptide arylation enzyme)
VVPEPSPAGLLAVVSSGAVLPPATERLCRMRFDVPVISVYGSTDGVNCHNATDGRPDPAVAAITITDADGTPLPAGATGEICALGPMTPLSYVSAPELNLRYRLPGGWVRTGDKGTLDRHGVLHVTGRLKQVVIRGGHTISPAEIEACLADHPAVSEAACVGLPDPDLGERLCACVVPHLGDTSLTLSDLTGFLRRQGLEPRKLPERLIVLPALPLGPTGKICRTTLTALASQATDPSGCPS